MQKRNKSLEALTDDKEKVMKDIKESIFRITIINLRTNKHIEDGKKRLGDFTEKLKNDVRLKLFKPDK